MRSLGLQKSFLCGQLFLICGGLLLAGCSDRQQSDGGTPKSGNATGDAFTGRVEVDGSSTVFPVTEAVAEEFQRAHPAVRVTVGISGTGGGFKKFTRGETDISDASRPITAGEMASAKENNIRYIELPICFDALTVIIHPQNTWAKTMTVAELKKIWEPAGQGTVTHWNHVRPEWPNEEIALFGAGSDSGTFDYFTEAVTGTARSSRGDFTASEDDNFLVQGVAGNKFALGFLGFSYFEPNRTRIQAVAIDPGTGTGVLPSMDHVLDGSYTPLSRPLFIYVRQDAAERPEVNGFVEFYLNNVEELATEVNYLPLPSTAYEKIRERFKARQTGSAFAGEGSVGLTVEAVLSRELKE